MTSEKEKIIETLEKPDKIIISLKDEHARYYYKYYKHLRAPEKFVMVLAKYLNSEGFIISTHFIRNIK